MTRFEVVVTAKARGHLNDIDGWWRANRTAAPDKVEEEFAEAIERLETAPRTGPMYRESALPEVRRILMEITRYHIYYSLDARARVVSVLAVWHSARGSGPPLR